MKATVDGPAEIIPFDSVIHAYPERDNPCYCGQDDCPDSAGIR